MMYGREKSDAAIVAGETDEQSGPNRSGAGGAKGGGRGGRETAKHGLGTEPGNHVTCAGARTGCRNISVLPVTPKMGACAGSCPTRIWVGGRLAMIVPTELRSEPTGPTRPSRNRGHCNDIVEVTAQ